MPDPSSAAPAGRRPSSSQEFPPLVWVGLAATVLMDSAAQVIWKLAALALPDSDNPWVLARVAVTLPATWILAALMLLQLAVWLTVLKRAELSFAQPLTSLSYVGVALLSWLWLGEPWHPRTLLSISLILAGVWLVSAADRPADAAAGTQEIRE